MNAHEHALVALRRELEKTEAEREVRRITLDEWIDLLESRRNDFLAEGSAEREVRLNREKYVMLRVKALGLKHSIEVLQRDHASHLVPWL